MFLNFEPGDYVVNPKNKSWGIGQIQSIIKNKATVNFQNNGKKVINLDNVELNVCSSTIIYGKKFDSTIGKKYEDLFNECKNTKNINYHGYLENKKIVELLKKIHIFSYPSIWPETSCLAAIESMAAG